MASSMDKVLEIRNGLTDLVDKLTTVFSTDEVIDEVMSRRNYITSPYADQIRATLKEVGIFKLDYVSDIQMVVPDIPAETLKSYGLLDRNGEYLLRGRFTVPIRDIMGRVTALTGWFPDVKKYVTTPTYGFSKDGQFFNIECFFVSSLSLSKFLLKRVFSSAKITPPKIYTILLYNLSRHNAIRKTGADLSAPEKICLVFVECCKIIFI